MKPDIDLTRLMKLRLVIARFGEMDLAKWWNTKGQLGKLGTAVIRRGLPRTHYFAQARSVFSVAAHRCQEIFDPPNSVTLWQLPMRIEDEFESLWAEWLDHAEEWKPFFQRLENITANDLKSLLRSCDLITSEDAELFPRLRRSAEGRAVLLPSSFAGTNQDIALLALGFARGEPGALAVPYALSGNA